MPTVQRIKQSMVAEGHIFYQAKVKQKYRRVYL